MKLLHAKYTYPLIILSLVVSTGLQFFWLQQLFVAQRKQLKEEIEQTVSGTSQKNIYKSLSALKDVGDHSQMRHFFLSPEWQQVRLAFDNMKMQGLSSSFSIIVDSDSTAIDMRFDLKKGPVKKHQGSAVYGELTMAEVIRNDSLSRKEMINKVNSELKKIGVNGKIYYTINDFRKSKILFSNVPKALKPAFSSNKYPYSFQYLYKYQVFVKSIDPIVWYRMRYYLASSILMILLTCAAFYFIIRLLRKQQLYADARADFTSNMTHEFKTPIATVAVALESITKYNLAKDPEKLQNYLDIGLHELKRLDLMVEKVLRISQESSSDHPLHPELYDVQSGLQQVISSMELQLQNSHASIRLNASEEPCFVFGDPVHLTNIFYNLIDNAIKYGGNPLDLEIECSCYTKTTILLSFKDNGPGIEKIYQKNIFERFFRVPSIGDIHNVKGSGLGLHYVKQMVEKHGGSIRLLSEPGKGSNFIITLPAAT